MTSKFLRSALFALAIPLGLGSASGQTVEITPTSGYNPDDTYDPRTEPPQYGSAALGQADPATGTVGGSLPLVSIGDPSQGGLVYVRDVSDPNGRRDNFLGTVEENSTDVVVTALGVPYGFDKSGSTYTASEPHGATLTKSGSTWSLIDRVGTVYQFDATLSSNRPIFAPGGRLTRVDLPDGSRLDLTYDTRTLCTQSGTSGSGCPAKEKVVRLLSVDSNLGYQIKYEYQTTKANYAYDDRTHARIVKVAGINKTVEACRPDVNGCSGLGSQWPKVTFSHSASGSDKIVTVTNALNQSTDYRYDASNRLRYVQLPGTSSGWDVTYTYDPNGLVSQVTGDPGTWSYTYSTSSGIRTTTIKDPGNNNWMIRSRTSDGQVTEERNPLGHSTLYYYHADGLLKEVRSPEGNSVVYSYDARGNVTRISPRNKTGGAYSDRTFNYPACTASNRVLCNKPFQSADWRGITYYNYSPTHGGMSRVRLVDIGQGWKTDDFIYGWKTAGYKTHTGASVTASVIRQIRTEASTGGKVSYTTQSGTSSNVLLTSVSAYGTGIATVATGLAYDQIGNLIRTDGPVAGTGDRTNVSYDALRRPVVTITPSPSGTSHYPATKAIYDIDGRVTALQTGYATGPEAFSSFVARDIQQNSYDSRGRLDRQHSAFAGSVYQAVDYAYDAVGRVQCIGLRMSAVTTKRGGCSISNGSLGYDRVNHRTYDAAGRVTRTISGYGTGDARTEEMGYTANGLVQWVKDGEGNRTTFEYDAHDQRTKVRYPVATNGSTSSGSDYDLYGYDAAKGLLLWHRKRDGQTINYGYDGLGRMTTLDAPGTAQDVTMSYDVHGRVTSAVTSGRTLSYGYDVLDRMTSETGTNGTTSYQYDAAGQRSRMNYPGAGGFYVTYEWGAAGELVRIREMGSTVLATFAYDELGRRKSLTRGNGVTTSYGFDAARLSDFDVDVPGSTAYDLLADFEHNPAGQVSREIHANSAFADMARSDELAFEVDDLNRYTKMYRPGSVLNIAYDARGNLTSDGVEGYGYDVLNRLTSVTRGSNMTSLAYDAAGRLWQEAAPSSAGGTRRFAYDGSDLIAEFDTAGAVKARYVHGPGFDEPLVWYEGSGTTSSSRRYLSADERGSIVLVTNATGGVIRRNQYDTDGTPHGSNLGRFGYTGQTKVSGTDVWHYKGRAYSPRLARFLQTDPIGYGDGLNWYAYVGGDSLNGVDPTGLSDCPAVPNDVAGIAPDCEEGGGQDDDPFATCTTSRIPRSSCDHLPGVLNGSFLGIGDAGSIGSAGPANGLLIGETVTTGSVVICDANGCTEPVQTARRVEPAFNFWDTMSSGRARTFGGYIGYVSGDVGDCLLDAGCAFTVAGPAGAATSRATGVVTATRTFFGRAGPVFGSNFYRGRGNAGILNQGRLPFNFRVGFSYNADSQQQVFRFAVGSNRNTRHWDVWSGR